ncbi:MAG: DUF2384 domain-containing protein [Chitinophagaceae bacterium]|nr:MAG: DUF2384 domain-containing protein [Chitinophagaceae bacterium]
MSQLAHQFRDLQLNDGLSIVYNARKGVRPSVFYLFSDSVEMPEKKLAALLHLHPRTISNYRDGKKNLNPIEGEHLLKLIHLYSTGENVFGSVAQFTQWLESPSWKKKEKPMDWLNTPGGVDLVLDEVLQLSHGYPV